MTFEEKFGIAVRVTTYLLTGGLGLGAIQAQSLSVKIVTAAIAVTALATTLYATIKSRKKAKAEVSPALRASLQALVDGKLTVSNLSDFNATAIQNILRTELAK